MIKYIIRLKKKHKNFYFIFLAFFFGVIFINSSLDIYEKRNKVFYKISKDKERYEYLDSNDEKDKFWAQKIVNGGYILYFRHAEREKWLDVVTYDAVEMINNIDAEKTNFKKATCLSSRGIEQAKIMGEIIDLIGGLNVQEIISSPSCRARQTALYAFKKEADKFNNDLLHYGPFDEDRKILFKNLRELLLGLNVEKKKNIVITGHNTVMDAPIFDESKLKDFVIDEGGFVVIEKKGDKLIAQHKFVFFADFAKRLLKRPKNF